MFRGRSISLKQGLLLVVLAALLPITITNIMQSVASWNETQATAIGALRAKATAVAERERDAFLVSNRLLTVAAANPDIRDIGARCSEVLKAGFNGYDPIINFLRTDASGQARCSILPFREGQSFVGEPWWEASTKAESITVSQPTIGTVSKIPIIIIALPLRDESGSFLGTLSAGLNISKLENSVSSAPEAKTGAIAIVSSNGALVASDTVKLPFKLPANLKSGVSGVLETPGGGKWAFETVALSGKDLFVLYAEPRSRIMSAALAQFRASIILPIIAIFLTICAIWFGTNRLVIRWLNELRRLSGDMARGDFAGKRQAFANAPIEMRELSDDLHDMAEVIDSRTAELTAALDAKTKLTREVHHRVKNNLQIMTSLLTMQASRMTDESAQAALKQARARVVALALIHRLTYEQDNDSSKPTVALGNLLEELCKQLRYAHREHRSIDLVCRTDDYAVPIDLAVPLALFIVEAVTNSYRHAFTQGEKGTIELVFELKGNEAILTVGDSGRGYDVANAHRPELGTELMRGFASQLNGRTTFSSDPGAGSVTTLVFPAEQHEV